MPLEIRYGARQRLLLDLSPDTLLADASRIPGAALDDPASSVTAALADPLEFPPFAKAILPGDQVAVPVEMGVPRTPSLVAGAIHAIVEAMGRPQDITIVLAQGASEDLEQSVRSLLPAEVSQDVQVVIHHPDHIEDCCYLASSKEGHPIYFNRHICEADVVLPIVNLRLRETLGYAGALGGLFPAFSDNATQKRYRAPTITDWVVHQRRRQEEVDEATWLLGIQCSLFVIPGLDESVLHVVAGEPKFVEKEMRPLCEATWLRRVPQRAQLVIAAIDGGPDQQTWENFARALFAADQIVADGGAIVICSELACAPGPALLQLAAATDPGNHLQRDLRRERSEDAISAALLADIQERVQVYLVSHLRGELVEDLGLGHVESVNDVRRLAQRHRSCILLGGAQYAHGVG